MDFAAATPLCQLAGLLAGMADYTRTNADVVRRQIDEPTEPEGMFEDDAGNSPHCGSPSVSRHLAVNVVFFLSANLPHRLYTLLLAD